MIDFMITHFLQSVCSRHFQQKLGRIGSYVCEHNRGPACIAASLSGRQVKPRQGGANEFLF